MSGNATPVTEQLRLTTLLGLFLIPGALMTVVWVVIAPFIETAGFPPIAALLVAILIVLVPFELGVIVRASRGRTSGIWSVIPYRRRLPVRDWLWLVPPVDGDRADGHRQPVRMAPGVVRATHRS